MKKYYLWSKKRTKGEFVQVFWRPDCRGYTMDLNQAGVYTEREMNGVEYTILTKDTIHLKTSSDAHTFAIEVEDIEILGKKMACILT